MNALIIYSHPNPDSYNGAVLTKVKETLTNKGVQFKIKDLYQMKWNPVLSLADIKELYSGKVPQDIAVEQEDVRQADVLIFIYPIWWFERPAMLKGWFDRVFSQGFSYRFTEEGMVEGLLKGKRAVVITTSGANKDNMEQTGILASIDANMLKGSLGFSGLEVIKHKNLYQVPTISHEERVQMLQEVGDLINQL